MNIELEVNQISKSYKKHKAISELSFSVPKGSIFGLIGPNGAGKSTLIRTLVGIYRPDSGKILFREEEVSYIPSSEIGYLPEERGLYRKMKVKEHLVYLARVHDLSKKEALKKTETWLTRMNLLEWQNHSIDQLSKGMQQKIQFIAAVIHDPSFIILDEPFSGFDPVNAELLKKEITRLNKEDGKTFIFSTHRMENAEEMCDHLVMINKSKICLSGSVNEVKKRFEKDAFIIESNIEIKDLNSFSMGAEKRFKYRVPSVELKNMNVLNEVGFISVKKDVLSLHEIFLKVVSDDE